MKNLLDLHTHTISSGHAYSTLAENVAASKLAGLNTTEWQIMHQQFRVVRIFIILRIFGLFHQ